MALSLLRPGKAVGFPTQLGHLGNTVTSQGRQKSHRPQGRAIKPFPLFLEPLSSIQSSSFLPLGPQTAHQPRFTRWACAQPHADRSARKGGNPTAAGKEVATQLGKQLFLLVNLQPSLPLWMPMVFCLFNNNKHKVQENGFLLEGGWEDEERMK